MQERTDFCFINLAPLLYFSYKGHSCLSLQSGLSCKAFFHEWLQASLKESIRNGKKRLAKGIIIFFDSLKVDKVLCEKQMCPDVGKSLQHMVLPPLYADFLLDDREGLEGKSRLEITDFSESTL